MDDDELVPIVFEPGRTVHGIRTIGTRNTSRFVRCGFYSQATGQLLHTSDVDADGRIVTPAHFDEPTVMYLVLETTTT